MMRNGVQLLLRRPGHANAHFGVYLTRVGVDYFRLELQGPLDSPGGFAACGGAHHGVYHRKFGRSTGNAKMQNLSVRHWEMFQEITIFGKWNP
jgi:hypothetical protein